MHTWLGAKVNRYIFLPAIGSTSKRTREIDVLLTADIVSYPVRIPIECKNEKSPIGTPKIDAFVGKLADVGIANQHGIYVSTNGYTKSAIERALAAGIKPLVLSGI